MPRKSGAHDPQHWQIRLLLSGFHWPARQERSWYRGPTCGRRSLSERGDLSVADDAGFVDVFVSEADIVDRYLLLIWKKVLIAAGGYLARRARNG
jgi:hypothetical protein